MAGGNSCMADWDVNEAPRTRVILVDSHVLAGASLHARDDTPSGRQIVIISPSPAEPRNYPGPQQDTSSSQRLAGTVTCQPDHGIRARAELRDRRHVRRGDLLQCWVRTRQG